jgi:hypothetical protein
MSQIICPACGMHHMDLGRSTRLISWTDDCGCSDHGPCVYHQIHRDYGNPGVIPIPERPSQETMLLRAQAATDREHEKWVAMGVRFEKIRNMEVLLQRAQEALWEIAESEGLAHQHLKLHDEIKAHLTGAVGAPGPEGSGSPSSS